MVEDCHDKINQGKDNMFRHYKGKEQKVGDSFLGMIDVYVPHEARYI